MHIRRAAMKAALALVRKIYDRFVTATSSAQSLLLPFAGLLVLISGPRKFSLDTLFGRGLDSWK